MTLVEKAEAHFQEGMRHVRSGDFAAAAASFRRAADAYPNHGNTHNNLGSALAALGRHDEATRAFREALRLDPNHAQAHFNLGASLRILARHDEAAACFARAVEIDPAHDEAYYLLGLEHQAKGRLNEAVACFLRAADLSPENPSIYRLLANALARLRLPGATARALEKLLSLDPDDGMTRANLMDQLANDCDWDRLEAHRSFVPSLGIVGGPVHPFALLTFDDHPQRHRARAEKFADATYSSIKPLPVPARPDSRPERLRIGYFSADFHDHATMYLAARMFELHDRDRFSIHAYSYGAVQEGAMRQRARSAFDDFTDVRELSDQAIAELARADGIDIAVDLKGYTEFGRFGIFAYRPAPIQIGYLGYPGTLGARFIDYLIADRIVIPDEHRDGYSERVIYLPHTYQVNDNRRVLPDGDAVRADAGLPAHGFVFCCFNYSYKLSPAEFGIWMELLRQVEGSVLWLLASPGNMEGNLRQAMKRNGIDEKRLFIAPKTDLQTHLARLRCADLFLDTFNCNAHTTASDALWVGVPLVTKAGRSFAARVGASLLHAAGASELVTSDEREYAQLALMLAKDPDRLGAIRAKLVAGRATSPLFDSARFTRHIEAGFDLAYQRYIDGQAPADILVPA